MKHLQIYEAKKNDQIKQISIEDFCKLHRITTYEIDSNGFVNVRGSVNINRSYMNRDYLIHSDPNMSKIPIKFGRIDGNFIIDNWRLTTLENSPTFVLGRFSCGFNSLTNLKFCPEVGGDFDCSSNRLTSLEGCPKTINGYFNCARNRLETLVGGPETVKTNFYCNNNRLPTLIGGPLRARDYFAYYNRLYDTYGLFTENIPGRIVLSNNPVNAILKVVPRQKQKRFISLLNDYNVIRGNIVIQDRLEEAMFGVGEKMFKKYEIR